MSTGWNGSIETGYFENPENFYLQKKEDSRWYLGNKVLDDEDLDFQLSIEDLLSNPVLKVAFIDSLTGKLPIDIIPNVAEKTLRRNSIAEMLSIPPSQVTVGDVCVLIGASIPGGASFRLAFPDPTNLQSWTELKSRYANWNDIQGKPRFEPAYDEEDDFIIPSSKHLHDERYPVLNNRKKIPVKFIEAIPTNNRFRVQTIQEMLSLQNAVKGDVCTVIREKKRFQLFGLASNFSDWEMLEDPEGLVASVNGQSGNVFLTPDDIGALPDDITFVSSVNGQNGNVELTPEDIGAANATHLHESILTVTNTPLEFYHNGTNLYYKINGGAWLPFA
jgi:hypothetical protein